MLRRAAVLGIALTLAACTEHVVLNDMWDGGPDLATFKDASYPPSSDASCKLSYYSSDYWARAAQLMILLDRSLSMLSQFGNTTREAAAQSALINSIATYQSKVKFGFEQFPADSSDPAYKDCQRYTCCAGSVSVVPTINYYFGIKGPIQCSDSSPCPVPSNDSVSHAALAQVRDYYKSIYPPSSDDQYVLLVTAAEPSCSAFSDSDEACTNALRAASDLGNMGVSIVVLSVGYQPDAGSCLVRISQTGSLLSPPSTLYTPSTVNALNNAVDEFVSAVARTGCTFDLYYVPPPLQAELTVSLGKTAILQDDQNGWSFANPTRTSITLSGSACDQYVGSQYNKISVGYTCSPCDGANACPQWQ